MIKDPVRRKERQRIANRKWKKKHPAKVVEQKLQSRYGLSLDEYKELLTIQDNKCAICRRSETESPKKLAVDHDHNTKRVRGLLCSDCNRAIGLLADSPEIIYNALVYVSEG